MSSHKKIIHRVSRVIGQLNSLKEKLEDEKYDRVKVMTQLKATQGALKSLEAEIVKENVRLLVDTSDSKKEMKKDIETLINGMS